MHDATKALLGSTGSSARSSACYDSDPTTFVAGLAVSQSSVAGVLSLLKSAGRRIGISAGRSQSDTSKTTVIKTGESVPVKLALKRATGSFVITSYANLVSGTDDSVTVGATVFTAQAGAATLGQTTFQAATGNNETAASLAAQINAHATAGALVKAVASTATVTLYAKVGGAAGNSIALAYTDNDTNVGATKSGTALAGGSDTISDINYVTKGAKVYFNDFLGLADFSTTETTVSDAVYVSGVLSGIDESGATVPVALVDMPGGV